ncbi:hypothetical protein [Bacillus sp. SD088]|nr:hypothetical protein [Bacillus sp. SD088]
MNVPKNLFYSCIFNLLLTPFLFAEMKMRDSNLSVVHLVIALGKG